MQFNNGITWWKIENDKEKELVINGFKELYNHSNSINIDTNKIITLMQEQKQIIIEDTSTINMISPFIPRSRANQIIIHNFFQTSIKKEKDIREPMNDLRGIVIIPAIIMFHGNITILYLSSMGNNMLSKYQHGGRTQYSTNTVKMS